MSVLLNKVKYMFRILEYSIGPLMAGLKGGLVNLLMPTPGMPVNRRGRLGSW